MFFCKTGDPVQVDMWCHRIAVVCAEPRKRDEADKPFVPQGDAANKCDARSFIAFLQPGSKKILQIFVVEFSH